MAKDIQKLQRDMVRAVRGRDSARLRSLLQTEELVPLTQSSKDELDKEMDSETMNFVHSNQDYTTPLEYCLVTCGDKAAPQIFNEAISGISDPVKKHELQSELVRRLISSSFSERIPAENRDMVSKSLTDLAISNRDIYDLAMQVHTELGRSEDFSRAFEKRRREINESERGAVGGLASLTGAARVRRVETASQFPEAVALIREGGEESLSRFSAMLSSVGRYDNEFIRDGKEKDQSLMAVAATSENPEFLKTAMAKLGYTQSLDSRGRYPLESSLHGAGDSKKLGAMVQKFYDAANTGDDKSATRQTFIIKDAIKIISQEKNDDKRSDLIGELVSFAMRNNAMGLTKDLAKRVVKDLEKSLAAARDFNASPEKARSHHYSLDEHSLPTRIGFVKEFIKEVNDLESARAFAKSAAEYAKNHRDGLVGSIMHHKKGGASRGGV